MEQAVENPKWCNGQFADSQAQAFWIELPQVLRDIAIREFSLGNTAEWIIQKDGPVVILSFEKGPIFAPEMNAEVKVHREHSYGNYCYEGTKCTIEMEGHFLTFSDPYFKHPE